MIKIAFGPQYVFLTFYIIFKVLLMDIINNINDLISAAYKLFMQQLKRIKKTGVAQKKGVFWPQTLYSVGDSSLRLS